ncbi:MAG: Omp28-related outer membrane protein, partial [Muribaculaceae bacterium]|nr:Omp28-related outer membrane protein [Muribaculaceae bacterium]
CPNCPRGIVAIDNLHRIYGDKFIPIALHCYTGDELGTGLHAHANFLGLVGAPSGTVNRTGTTSPMLVVDNKWTFSTGATGNNLDDLSWLDMAQREFEKQADAQITIASTFNDDTREFSLDCTVKSAISLTGQNINLMTVVTEDDVLTYQVNNNHADDNPLLGEWGQGGKYGSSTVYPYYAQHVARAYYGQTFNGTGGLIPQAIESGKDYTTTITGTLPTTVNVPDNCHIIVMMIDGNSNKVINADQVSLTGRSGIESVTANKQAAKVMTAGHKVIVSAEGDLTAEVYNLAGNLVGSASGTDLVEVDAAGVNGVAIVRVSSAAGISVTKTIIR